MLVQVVVKMFFYEVVYEVTHRYSVGRHILGSQFCLCLGFEYRLFYLDTDCSNHTLTYISHVKVFVVKFPDGLDNSLSECYQVGSTLSGVLPIYEGIVLLSILFCMSHRNLQVFTLEMDGGIDAWFCHLLFKQIEQSILGNYGSSVICYCKSRVEEGIVLKKILDKLFLKPVAAENITIGSKFYIGTVGFICFLDREVVDKLSPNKVSLSNLSISECLDSKLRREGIYGLHTDTVQSN